MKNLFRVCDYIKISSADDCVEELKRMSIHFEMAPKDVHYWVKQAKGESGKLFNQLLSGKELSVEDNCLTIELSKELAENDDEKCHLVEALFGTAGCAKDCLPIPNRYYDYIDIAIRVVPGSASWVPSGRTIVVHFSTEVSVLNRIERPSRRELENGISCDSVGAQSCFQIVRELIENPDGVEYFRAARKGYVILKSNDEKILLRKFYLKYRSKFQLEEQALLEFARIFIPSMESALKAALGDSQRYKYQRKPYNYFPVYCSSCYYIERNTYFDCGTDYVKSTRSLISAFQKCIEKIESTLQKRPSNFRKTVISCSRNPVLPRSCHHQEKESVPEKQKYHFAIENGFVDLQLDDYDIAYGDSLQQMKEELQTRIKKLQLCADIVELELGCDKNKPLCDVMAEMAFRKIWIDPISYTGQDAGDYRSFALTLV